jgi:hypothetical protein
MTRFGICFSLLLSIFVSNGALAQPVAGMKEISRQNISFELSMSPAFLGEFVYHYRLDNIFKDNDVVLHTTLGTPLFLIKELDSFRIGGGASIKYGEWGNFTAVAVISTSLATSENVNGKFIAWGLGFALQPGYYKEKWFIGLNLAGKQSLMTHVKHSNYARSVFEGRYPEGTPPENMIIGPKDGWYRTPAQRWQTGLVAGYKISKSITLYGGGGIDYTPNEHGIFMFADVGIIPFYGQIGVVYHLYRE